ncbi:MAG TPA: long-chain fatty acid--CoA ligase, partial [Deltaproteobacteria bacterium]|nr:long-chain fatty acid--CoA ligase [Deltaproteobacteria bacterium]
KELPPNKEGEIIVSGPNVMKGYLNRPEATKEVLKQDWFYTGDIGKIDEDGYIYILDRKKDLIIKGGFNVYPREVEELLLYHPKVKEVAVIGVPDSIQGEEVKAYVVLKDGKRASKDEIINYCQEHMALYKCPKYVVFLRQLPNSPAGRVLKRRLKAFTAAEET